MADRAVSASMQFEAKKDALGQVQSGDWKLRFTVCAADVPQGLLTAPMGARYQVVIVEIGDDEQPVEQKSHKLSQQSAIYCEDKVFQDFMMYEYQKYWAADGTKNKRYPEQSVRNICKVESRAEFDTDPEAAKRWISLRGEFDAWKKCL